MIREIAYVLLAAVHLLLEITALAPAPTPASVLFVYAYWLCVYCIECLLVKHARGAPPARMLWILIFPFFALPVGLFVYLKCVLGTNLDRDIVYALLQTTPQEALEFSSQYAIVQFLAVHWLAFGLVAFYVFRQPLAQSRFVQGRRLPLAFILGAGAAVLLAGNSSVCQLFIAATADYEEELAVFSLLTSQRRTEPAYAKKRGHGETYLLIIGESVNRDYMSAYGYPKDTTPYLAAMAQSGRAILLRKAYSNDVFTNQSLALALTEANQYNGRRFETSRSIIEVANAAGFGTYWLSNQPRYSVKSNRSTLIASAAGVQRFINKKSNEFTDNYVYDGQLADMLGSVLGGLPRGADSLIVVHLQGSHAGYCNRYPDQFARKDDLVTCYENSLRYTDSVVKRMIDSFLGAVERGAVLYFSDHGESVSKRRGHIAAGFTFAMARIPVFFVFTDAYAAARADLVESLKANAGRAYTNDLVFDTVVGLLGIDYPGYAEQWDISSSRYGLSEADAKTLRGSRYVKDDNEPAAQ